MTTQTSPQNNSSHCKVITTYFGKRFSYPENANDTIEILKDSIQNEINLNPGVDNLDIIIVNHNCGVKIGNDYLNSINGLKTYCGRVKVIHRPWNDGRGISLESMDYAFNMFNKVYDYWFFQEDDYKVCEENYYLNGIKMLKDDIAFIGYDMETWKDLKDNGKKIKRKLNLIKYLTTIPQLFIYGLNHTKRVNNIINSTIHIINQGHIPFCTNMTGITHRKYLQEVVNSKGELPHPKIKHNRQNGLQIKNPFKIIKWGITYITWYVSVFVFGEIEFTRVYHDLGYIIECYPHSPGLIHQYKNNPIR
tara:strand:- start:864 stop:1781 length:918 start_codon:yes stop_codon:yes gene_type:complete